MRKTICFCLTLVMLLSAGTINALAAPRRDRAPAENCRWTRPANRGENCAFADIDQDGICDYLEDADADGICDHCEEGKWFCCGEGRQQRGCFRRCR